MRTAYSLERHSAAGFVDVAVGWSLAFLRLPRPVLAKLVDLVQAGSSGPVDGSLLKILVVGFEAYFADELRP